MKILHSNRYISTFDFYFFFPKYHYAVPSYCTAIFHCILIPVLFFVLPIQTVFAGNKWGRIFAWDLRAVRENIQNNNQVHYLITVHAGEYKYIRALFASWFFCPLGLFYTSILISVQWYTYADTPFGKLGHTRDHEQHAIYEGILIMKN